MLRTSVPSLLSSSNAALFSATCRCLKIRTHFDVLSVPLSSSPTVATATLDTAALQKTLHSLQRRYHPDTLVGRSPAETARCEAVASEINSSYKVLKDDYTRQRYIAYCVALLKKATTENDNNIDAINKERGLLTAFDAIDAVVVENDDIKLGETVPVEFLEEMLDLHEELEDAEEDGLAEERKAEMLQIVDTISGESKAECERILTAKAGGYEFWVKQVEQYQKEKKCSFESLSDESEGMRRKYIQSVMKWTYARNLQMKIRDLE